LAFRDFLLVLFARSIPAKNTAIQPGIPQGAQYTALAAIIDRKSRPELHICD